MSDQSPIQRFLKELRRRHVPQTAAVYLVAAWAAIEFADVVVPNLNGPQWVVTAVIVAALVGFPAMLIMAWVFDWGPEGLHRTAERSEHGAVAGAATPPSPWFAAVAVLVVVIATALAVAFVLGEAGGGAAPEAAGGTSAARPSADADERRGPPAPPDAPPELEILGPGFADSIQRTIYRSLGELDTLDLRELRELSRLAAEEAGIDLLISEPEEWRVGLARRPVPLTLGDTLAIEGVAHDTAGVLAVVVDGETVAEADGRPETLPFSARLTGTGNLGIRRVEIVVRTPAGDRRHPYEIVQLPADGP